MFLVPSLSYANANASIKKIDILKDNTQKTDIYR